MAYSFETLMNRRLTTFYVPIWCLLSVWLVFTCLELAEHSGLISETVAEDQGDPDMEALSLLASGLKRDVPSLNVPCCTTVSATLAELPLSRVFTAIQKVQPSIPTDPPPLRLHQQVSVYRI